MGQITDTLRQSDGPYIHFNSMPVSIRGVVYPSVKMAGAALGIKPATISQHLCRHGHADRAGLGERKGGAPGNKNRAKPITIGGIHFPSRKEAMQELRISRKQLNTWTSPDASAAMKDMLYLKLLQYSARKEGAKRLGTSGRRGK